MARRAESVKPAVTFAVETVTPAIAAKYLERNKTNRQLGKRTVAVYAAAMKRGEWQMNGESIKFDRVGNLIDGQHRLHAIVQSGVTVELAVFRELESESFSTIDTGRNRTAGDVLSIVGHTYANEIAAATRILYAHTADMQTRSAKLSNSQLLAFLDQHPKLIECANAAMTKPLQNSLVPNSVTIFGYYSASLLSPDRAHRFFAELASGRFSSRGSDAIYQLRERLIKTGQEAIKPTSAVKCGWIVSAWNAFYNGRAIPKMPRTLEGIVRFDPSPYEGRR